ncbi:MAG TPA: ribonuclease [Sphingomonadaceae bacterium]|nr:ribonuclease [Sphingomonadaceae bacterium]
MAEWLYEAGIGEARAALVEGDAIVEARIEREEEGPRVGAVLSARLVRTMPETKRALVTLESGAPAMLRPVPMRIGEGAPLRVTITREAIPEEGNPKPALARLATEEEAPSPGPSLHDRIVATGHLVRQLDAHESDALEAAGWSEVLEEAHGGLIVFPGGLLRLALTPAMTLFDVDGSLAPGALAIAGAAAAARAIRRLDIGGSIGIDLPSAQGKADRQAAAAAVDAWLPPPFERTAVNGFGFLQIVRPRPRVSLPERIRVDPVLTAALALLRRAERAGGAGRRTIAAAPVVIRRLAAAPQWLEMLGRRTGAAIDLRELPGAPISGGDVHVEHPPA